MLGNSEKTWSTIMNAGLGYVLIQMSPLFLDSIKKMQPVKYRLHLL